MGGMSFGHICNTLTLNSKNSSSGGDALSEGVLQVWKKEVKIQFVLQIWQIFWKSIYKLYVNFFRIVGLLEGGDVQL